MRAADSSEEADAGVGCGSGDPPHEAPKMAIGVIGRTDGGDP
jgi:hypothetical protein